MHNKEYEYLITFAYGGISILELASIHDSKIFEFEIVHTTESAALVKCNPKVAIALVKRLGGAFKIAVACGSTFDDLFESMVLPERPKFNWTVSGYGCSQELLDETRLSVQEFLKSKSLGKSRFLEPRLEKEDGVLEKVPVVKFKELKLMELYENILSPKGKTPEGLDVVVHGAFGGEPIFGQTIAASDATGFEKRDFTRSYQDPTITIGPRLGRVLVNLAMQGKVGTLLDPFCGLGTILQEALICGYNVVGVDISRANIQKTMTNLNWLKKSYGLSPKIQTNLFRADSTNLQGFGNTEIDGVATEPILVPKLESNPTFEKSENMIRTIKQDYERSLLSLARVLHEGSRVSIVVPSIVDNRGREHGLELRDIIASLGYRIFAPSVPDFNVEYPFKVSTTKRKIVRRNIYVIALA